MAPAIDLRPDHRKIVEDILREHLPHGVKVWVFGSRAEWTTKESSDLDLALEHDGPLDSRIVMALDLAFEESLLPFRVDVLDLHGANEGFREIVLQTRVPLSSGADLESTRCPDAAEELGRQWADAQWGDLATLEYGRTLRGYRESPGTFRVYGTNGPIGWHTEPLCSHPTVIVGRKGAYRGVHYSPRPPYVIDTAFYLKPKRNLDVRWAYYALLTKDINGLDAGSAIPSTRREDFYSLPVSLPPPPEQRAIAHVLGALDDRIELNRRMNETLEAMARALFKSWFVDFDPVRAKVEGRDTGLPPHIAGLFPNRLVESESGHTPVGWATFVMQDLATLHKDTTDPQILGDLEVEHFSIPAFDAGGMPTLQSGRSIRSNKMIVPTNAVLLSKLNPETSRVWIPHCPRGVPQLCSTEFLAFTPVRNLSRSLLYGLFTSRAFRSLLTGMVTETSKSHQRVQPRALARTTVLAGTAALFDCYDRMISGLLESIPGRRLQTQRLGDLRDTLLPKLVAGEVRLPAALFPEAA